MGRKDQKSGKAKWRKKIDISDVEQALVDRRNEQISHGAPIRDLEDSSLFVVDKSKAKPAPPKPKRKKEEIRAQARRSEAGLVHNPRVKPMVMSYRKEGAKGVPSAAEMKKVKRMANARTGAGASAGKGAAETEGDGIYDLWDAPAPPPKVPAGVAVDFVESALKKPVKAPRTLRVPTKAQAAGVRAVAAVEPGESYNPAFDAHQDLLGVALAREVKREDVRAQLRDELCVDKKLLPSESVGLRVDTGDTDEDEDEEAAGQGAEEAGSGSEAGKAVEARKKTKAERNKDARKRAEAEAARLAAEERRKVKDLNRLAEIQKEVETKAAAAAPKGERQGARPPRLGKRLYEEPAPDFLLEEELPGTLRELKPAGNLVRDRFKSLQQRQILEPRMPQKKRRRYQVKILTKERT